MSKHPALLNSGLGQLVRAQPAPTQARTLEEEFHQRAVPGVQSADGFAEGRPPTRW
ncbi:hypothetical protein [Amycolatopsis sp. lyj-90]|uniref:hypothetical protein n=1 Tax=Amycolatopsis sp. lyj-90 TaxID=2789285 RepID=UPI00397E291F